MIVADDDSYVSYLEGCTAPMRDENQLHAAIVEIVVHDRAEVKYAALFRTGIREMPKAKAAYIIL